MNLKSERTAMMYGVPQGAVLGPLLFNLYMLPLGHILQIYSVAYQSYADDTQIYLALSPNDYGPIDLQCHCLEEVKNWMQKQFLQLNKDKTNIIVFFSKEGSTSLDPRGLKTNTYVKSLDLIIN